MTDESTIDPRDPRPEDVRVLRVSEGDLAVPKAYSADVVCFDHEPADAELASILGRRHSFRMRREETADGFRVREPGAPMPWVMGWTGFITALASGLILAFRDDPLPERLAFCLMFAGVAAATTLLFWGIDRHIRAQPDVMRFHRARGLLEAPGSGLRVSVEEVIACVRLKRWYFRASGSESGSTGGDVRQLGVLVPAGPGLPGRIAYHPLAQELVIGHPRNQVIDDILRELDRPVREINLTLDEVWALGPGA